MKKIANEIKVGIFVVIAICVGFIFWAKTQNFSSDTYQILTNFGFAGGLKQNAIVKLSGIEVGRVEKINFKYDPETKIEAVLVIKKSAKPHSDAIAYIGTSGFIGDAFVGLTPGSAGTPFVKNGDAIGSEDPMDSRDMMKQAKAIADKIDSALVDIKDLARNVNITFSDNEDKINNIVENLEETSINFKEFSEDIKWHPWKLLIKGKEEKKKK